MTNWLGWSDADVAAHQARIGAAKGRIVRQLDKPAPKPVAKYKAVPTEIDGVKFASRKEAKRYKDLLLLQKAGKISDLKLQPVIRCVVNGELVCKYIADFFYIDLATMKDTFEDAKGYQTPVYRLKRKLVHACTGITILET